MPYITRRRVLLSIAPASLAPLAPVLAKSWEQPSFPNWKPEFVDQILTDSPWARPSTIKVPLPPDDPPGNSKYAQIDSPGTIRLPIPRVPGTNWPGSSDPRTNPRTQP